MSIRNTSTIFDDGFQMSNRARRFLNVTRQTFTRAIAASVQRRPPMSVITKLNPPRLLQMAPALRRTNFAGVTSVLTESSDHAMSRLSRLVHRAEPVLRQVAPLAAMAGAAMFAPSVLPLLSVAMRGQTEDPGEIDPGIAFPVPTRVQRALAPIGLYASTLPVASEFMDTPAGRIVKGAVIGAIEDIPIVGGAVRGVREAIETEPGEEPEEEAVTEDEDEE